MHVRRHGESEFQFGFRPEPQKVMVITLSESRGVAGDVSKLFDIDETDEKA